MAKQLLGPMQGGREGRQMRRQPPQLQSPVKKDYTKSQTAMQQCMSLRGGTTNALPSSQQYALTAYFAIGLGHEATCATCLMATH